MGVHSRLSPSAAKQILNCTPSLTTGERFKDEESPYAAEGSAGHALAEYLVKRYLKIRTRRPTSDYYTEELVEAVEEYVAYVIEQIEEAKKMCKYPILTVEQRVDLSIYVEGCFGTADMVIVTDTKVHIIDLKLGKGVEVSAEGNYQLMIYALGVVATVEMLFEIETVELTIVQPRLCNFSTWEMSVADLKRWAEEEFVPKAKMALAGEGEFHAGDWCRFCKARFQCRERAQEYLKIAQMEFKDPPLLTDEEMAEVLLKTDGLKKWVEEVYTYAQSEAANNHREWPGFKLVEGRANRKYTDEEKVVEAAKSAGYTDVFKQTLIGITEMERLMGKKQFNEILGGLIYKPQGKVTLVPESDKREPINLATASDDFAE
ncbi:uncharacterized protein DUF2800 [Kineothrix alysoides]|uniref:Uncharacterized protein DUF2800 n=1 Tax=Kineothrix alysoides TaxID=1469948 RepID=A0A4R1R557_9FIRM|nr:DUF2800 domain-containing protein [Kineothrix alysoides]TCL60550.1 uncharacterized protein DUF2800 [Kineothrix alysoides]